MVKKSIIITVSVIAALAIAAGLGVLIWWLVTDKDVRVINLDGDGIGDLEYTAAFTRIRDVGDIFWWFYPTTATAAATRPLILCLDGVTGVPPSLLANLGMFGPYDMNFNERENSWVDRYNLLFIDAPLGTGFSTPLDNSQIPRNIDENAEHLAVTLESFYSVHEAYRNTSLYIFGQGHGAQLALALAIKLSQSEADSNLRGVVIGNGIISPALAMTKLGFYLEELGYIDGNGRTTIEAFSNEITAMVNNGHLEQAFEWFSSLGRFVNEFAGAVAVNLGYIVEKLTRVSPRDYFGQREYLRSVLKITDFDIMNTVVAPALGISSDVTYDSGRNAVIDAFRSSFMTPATEKVEYILNNTELTVCIYNGNLDAVSNTPVPRSKTGVKRKGICPDTLTAAVKEAKNGVKSIRKVAETYNLPKSTIFKYLKLNKCNDLRNNIQLLKNDVRKVFDLEEEMLLCKYLRKAAFLHMGLNTKQCRELAYQYAVSKQKTNLPVNWEKHKIAGTGWLRCFRLRFPELSLRKPEPTSIARATSFNRANVDDFYKNLKLLMTRHNFLPGSIYNVDETGISTVHKPGKVLAPKEIRQLGKMTSGERGVNTTMIGCINAVGNAVPPVFIFPRVFFKDNMLKGAPPDSLGVANQSGWSTEPIFKKFLDHFIKFTKPTRENPILLIMDNHETHISIEIIDKARENGIVLLTLPPHTSHHLQPLDRTVFGPFKSQYSQAADRWMLNNPGKPITIYDVAEIAGEAYGVSFTPKNIIKGFEVSGIYPYNRNIFSDENFLCSYVTDRPDPSRNLTGNPSQKQKQSHVEITETDQETQIINLDNLDQKDLFVDGINEAIPEPVLSIHKIPEQPVFRTPLKIIDPQITPETVRPFEKAGPRKGVPRGKKPGRTRILTDTPEKDEILEEALKKAQKKKITGLKLDKKKNTKATQKTIAPNTLSHSGSSKVDASFSKSNPTRLLANNLFEPGPSNAFSNDNTEKSGEKKIEIIQQEKLSFVRCLKCKTYSKDKNQMLKCSFCNHSYHSRCVPKSHRENFESDDEGEGFVCVACFILDNDDDSDESTQNLYEECRNVYK